MTVAAASFERMRFKRIVGRAWFTLEQRFFFVIPLALVTVLAPRVGIALITGHATGPLALVMDTGLGLVAGFISVVLSAWAAKTVSADVRHEERSSEGALGDVMRRYLPLAITALLVGIGDIIGFALLVIPGIIWWLATSVAIPAAVMEGLGPRAAIRRSLELTRGRRSELFGYNLLIVVVFTVVSMFAAFVANDFSFPSPEHASPLFEHWLKPVFVAVSAAAFAAFDGALYEELLAVPPPPPSE